MQLPTLQNTRLRNSSDAHRIFQAIELGILHMVKRRLDADERAALIAGNVYAWETRGESEVTGVGIERFTEGRKWDQSRIREDFLMYTERYIPPAHQPEGKAPDDWKPLTKFTYSAWVNFPSGRKKWAITAYVYEHDFESLLTIDDEPRLKDVTISPNHYETCLQKKPRNKITKGKRKVEKVIPAIPPANPQPPAVAVAPVSSHQDKDAVLMYDPYQSAIPVTHSSNQYPPRKSPVQSSSSPAESYCPSPSPSVSTTSSHSIAHSIPPSLVTVPSDSSAYSPSVSTQYDYDYDTRSAESPVFQSPSSLHMPRAGLSHGSAYMHTSNPTWMNAAEISNAPGSSTGYMYPNYHHHQQWGVPSHGQTSGVTSAPIVHHPATSLHPHPHPGSSSLKGPPHLAHLSMPAYQSGPHSPVSPATTSEYHSSAPPSPSTYSSSSPSPRYHPYMPSSKPPTLGRYRGNTERELVPEAELQKAQMAGARANTDSLYIEQLDRQTHLVSTPLHTVQHWETSPP